LLALEMDVTDLLPADDIGYGFDNIGDVLQVSPVLLERYLSTARKISRTAVGDTTIPVSYQTYDVPHRLIQDDRLDEGAPVGSRGRAIVRHLFPVDAEYEISVTLARNRDDEYLGLTRERKLDLRLDDRRLQLFTIAANPKKVVLGAGTAPDAHLKIRLPVKAGTRELAATFLKDTLVKEGIIDRVRGDDVLTYFEGVGSITVAGPFNVQGSGNTVTRDRIFICHPSAAAEQEACATKIVTNLAHRAYRRPVRGPTTSRNCRALQNGRAKRRLRSGREAGVAEDSGVARIPVPRGSRSAGCGSRDRLHDQRRRARVTAVLLPVEQYSRRPVAHRCGDVDASPTHRCCRRRSSACWPIRARSRW
jgi:hypothetical protein